MFLIYHIYLKFGNCFGNKNTFNKKYLLPFISLKDNFPENYNFPFAEQLKNQPYSISQTSSKDNLP